MADALKPTSVRGNLLSRARRAWCSWDRFATRPLPRGLEAVVKGLAYLLLALVIFLIVVDGLAPQGVRKKALRANCQSNLHQIALACSAYADENGGRFPEALQQLCPDFVSNAKLCRCPAARAGRVKGDGTAGTELNSHYSVACGLCSEMPRDFILAYDSSMENHTDEGRNVAFLDGHVQWWPAGREEEFQKRLAEQEEKMRTGSHRRREAAPCSRRRTHEQARLPRRPPRDQGHGPGLRQTAGLARRRLVRSTAQTSVSRCHLRASACICGYSRRCPRRSLRSLRLCVSEREG